MNGPFFVYSFGRLTIKGNMRMNKLDGEKLTLHSDSTLSSREFYKDGRKIGIWEEYSSYGSLTRRTYYNNHGKFIKREIFDQRGNLSRTEYEEKKY
jgi:antitoxin component YwqK of YwqJK toxin-antitoxin module